MTLRVPHRGGAPVGYLNELGPVEASAVRCLRLWFEGPQSRTKVLEDFSFSLGEEMAQQAVRSFEALCDLCIRHGRRPLMRHQVSCKCLGADESCFANFIGYASDGDHEDALLIATTLVTPHMAPPLVGLAQDFGLALRRLPKMASHTNPNPAILH